MAPTKKDSWETFNDLQSLLGKIKSLAHGAIASAEFYSDEDAEVTLMHMVKELTAEAEHLTSKLHTAALKTTPATAEDKGDIKILPPRICSDN
jgi:hypothetical protein